MSDPRVIVNVATHTYYPAYQRRLVKSIERWAPNVERMFWTNQLPPDSPPHSEVPYGFKLYAMEAARRKGYRFVVWFDTGVLVCHRMDDFWTQLYRDGYYIYGSGETLHHWCNDKTLDYYGVTREEAHGYTLLGGQIFGIDFQNERAVKWYEGMWEAMRAGLYDTAVSGTKSVEGHRGDEAIGSILARRLGMPIDPLGHFVVGDTGMPCPPGIFRTGYQPLMVTVAEHSFREELLEPGCAILDAGCRGFALTDYLSSYGFQCYAVDADPLVKPEQHRVASFENVAVVAPSHAGQPLELVCYGNGTGTHLSKYSTQSPPDAWRVMVPTATVDGLRRKYGVERFGLVKLDIEGAEYDILRQWPGPIAQQISVEFHEHIGANPYPQDRDRVYREIQERLGQWYKCDSHARTEQHAAGMNFWDSLWTLK